MNDEQVRMIRRLAGAKARYETHRRCHDADDYFQQGFLAVWECVTALDEPLHNLQAYVIARREMIAMDARSTRRRKTLAALIRERKGDLFARGAEPGLTIDVHEAFAVLDEIERTIIKAGFWRSLNVHEIARDVDLRIHLVCRANVEAKRKLAARLSDYEPPHPTKIARKYGNRIYDARRNQADGRTYVDRRAEMRERYLRSKQL